MTISVEEETWEKAKDVLKQLGMKQSSFINIIMKSLVDSETKPMKDVYGDITEMLLKEVRIRKRKKQET